MRPEPGTLTVLPEGIVGSLPLIPISRTGFVSFTFVEFPLVSFYGF
jgi:hypothetical protein